MSLSARQVLRICRVQSPLVDSLKVPKLADKYPSLSQINPRALQQCVYTDGQTVLCRWYVMYAEVFLTVGRYFQACLQPTKHTATGIVQLVHSLHPLLHSLHPLPLLTPYTHSAHSLPPLSLRPLPPHTLPTDSLHPLTPPTLPPPTPPPTQPTPH